MGRGVMDRQSRFTISNVESQVCTPNNSRLDPGSNPGCLRDKGLCKVKKIPKIQK